jgi:thymidylate synthase
MKAAFMNMYALTRLQSIIADELSRRLGRTISVGDYIDFSNSYHLYEPDFNKAEGLVKRSRSSVLEDRVWTTAVYNELVSKEVMYQRNQVNKQQLK